MGWKKTWERNREERREADKGTKITKKGGGGGKGLR